MAKNEFQFIYQVVYSFSKELNKTQKQWNNFTFSWTKKIFKHCEQEFYPSGKLGRITATSPLCGTANPLDLIEDWGLDQGLTEDVLGVA